MPFMRTGLSEPLIKKRIRGFPKSFWAQIYLLLALLEMLVVVIVQIVLLANISANSRTTTWTAQKVISSGSMLVYDSLFIVAEVFFLVIAWEAMAHKNTIQVIAATIFNYCLLVYSLIQYFQNESSSRVVTNNNSLQVLRVAIIAIITVCSLSFTALLWEIFLDFGWMIYKKLGADLSLRQMYKRHQILLTLLKLDIFFFVGYSVQLATLVLKVTDAETWIQIAVVIPGSVLVLFMSFFALQREHRRLMQLAMIIFALAPVYFIYKLVRMYTVPSNTNWDPYWDSRKYLTFFIIVNVLLIVTTLVYAWLCYRDFGRGLKPSIEEYHMKKAKIRDLIAENPALADKAPESFMHEMEGRERWQLE
ncbi:hypothetical protein H4R35_004075 [Dimargaris xerosporica]|nr:hypothetical protein H4R35_004075 [Dimargaris xerosporica]